MSLFGGILGSIFGGGAPKITTGPTPYQQLPDFVQQALQSLIAQGTSLSNNMNPATQQAYSSGVAGTPARGFMKGAQSAFGQAANFQNQIPGQIGMANGYLNAANSNIAQGTNPITAQMIGDQATQLMSPYTQNVINLLKNNFNDNLNSQLSQNNSNSTLAGAFGSDRAALENGQTRLMNDRAFGDQAGVLLNNAYQTAATNAQQNLQNERANFLTGAGLNIGQATGALGGANAYANAANSATQLGNANLQGNAQNNSNTNNRINQFGAAGNIPAGQLGILQSVLQSFAPFGGAGASQAYQPQGLLQQLGLTPQMGLNASSPVLGQGQQQGTNGGLGALLGLGGGIGSLLGFL